jgi:excinuclease ABC subunit C
MAGQDMVGVMTVVEGGEANKSEYRKFKIKTLSDANDPAALREVLKRRLEHPEWPFPQIIVADGNIIQKNALESVLQEFQMSIPVVAVVKNDRHKASRLMGPSNLLNEHKLSILLANAEAHRFAINYFRKTQRKRALE